jgi:hypothetical protein
VLIDFIMIVIKIMIMMVIMMMIMIFIRIRMVVEYLHLYLVENNIKLDGTRNAMIIKKLANIILASPC